MKRSKFNLSYYNLTTMEMGKLIPIGVEEVLPGDTFRHSTSVMLRAETLVRPLMHPMTLHVHSWFVPNRLLWSEWEKFIVKPQDPPPTFPVIPGSSWAKGNLLDHMGVPQGDQIQPSALPIRAYNKVYNEYYRDQDILPEVTEDQLAVQRVSWRKDYFTSARTDDVLGSGTNIPIPVTGAANTELDVFSTTDTQDNQIGVKGTDKTTNKFLRTNDTTLRMGGSGSPDGMLKVNLDLGSNLTVAVEDWRRAMSIQGLLEKRGRFGSRYTDYLRSLGIRPSDGRIDRPEYLGGGKQQVSFSEVLNTAGEGGKNVGDMSGHGIAGLRTRPYRRFFNEHGIVVTVAYLRPKSVYNTAVPATFYRNTYDEFWHKEYEAWGPEMIPNSRIYGQASDSNPFGYTGRHHHYRTKESMVTGGMRDNDNGAWHLARDFTSQPTLSREFIECSPSNRIFADTQKPEFYGMFNHNIVARRLVSRQPRH